ncbi:MAG: hypothetical protein ABW056_08275, partial [Thermoanaerobaculia bacterium]
MSLAVAPSNWRTTGGEEGAEAFVRFDPVVIRVAGAGGFRAISDMGRETPWRTSRPVRTAAEGSPAPIA